MQEVKFYFALQGRNVFVEFQDGPVRLTRAGQALVKEKIRHCVADLTGFRPSGVLFTPLEAVGRQRDKFFMASVEISPRWLRRGRFENRPLKEALEKARA